MKETDQSTAPQGIIVTPGPVISTPPVTSISLSGPASKGPIEEALQMYVEITSTEPAASKGTEGTTASKEKNSSINRARTTKSKSAKKMRVHDTENDMILAPEVIIMPSGQYDQLAPERVGKQSHNSVLQSSNTDARNEKKSRRCCQESRGCEEES